MSASKIWLGKLFGLAGTMLLLVSMIMIPLSVLIPHVSAVAPDDWWNASWNFRKAITIDHTKINGTLENFAVLIDVADVDLAVKAQSDGDDIVFTDKNGVRLNHEIEHYNSSSGRLIAWINMPLLTSTADTELHMYYGNPTAENQQNRTGVWDSGFVMVQHLEELSGTRYDSTLNGSNGTPYFAVSKSYAGKIDGADTFEGTGGYVNFSGSFLPTSAITLELWLKPLSYSNTSWTKYLNTGNVTTSGICGGQSSLAKDLWGLSMSWDYKKSFGTGGQPSGFDWVHFAITWNGTYAYAYFNGQKTRETQITGTPDWAEKPLLLGSNHQGWERFHGVIDEVRVSKTVRSANWILTSYNNQKTPSAFYIVGSEESYGGSPFVSNENPVNKATDVYTNPTLSVQIMDTDGDLMTILFLTNASERWETIGSYSNVTDGTYSVLSTNIKNLGTTYYWGVRVTDGKSWTNQTYSFKTTTTILKHKLTVSTLPKGQSGVLIADVAGNSLEEVIVAGNNSVTVLNGTDGRVVWKFPDDRIGMYCKPQIADLNRDGVLEIVVPLESPAGVLVLFGNNGSLFWEKVGLGLQTYSSPVIADIDGSGYPTIFFASTDVYSGLNGTGRVTSLSYDGRILYQTFAWRPCSGGLSIGDTNGDGEFELYMGDRFMYEWDADYGKGVRSFWAKNLTERWSRPDIVLSSHIPMLADVNKDGIQDVIAGHLDGGLAVFNSTDGSVINATLGIPDDAPVHYQPSVYDIDLDGNLEMLMADAHNETSDDIVIWDLVEWKADARMYVGKCYYGPQVADVTGDGIMEIIAANYIGIFVFNRTYSMLANITGMEGILNYAVVQDIDGDDYNELVISSQGGFIYVYDTPARQPNPRPRSEVQFYSEFRLGAAEYVPSIGAAEPVISSPDPPNLAVNIPLTLTHLSFTLTDYQLNLINYTVVTYPDIGSDAKINVGNNRYSLPISNLQYSTTYTWNVTATDGAHWNSKIYTFTTEPMPPWWNTDWKYRKPITINRTKVVGDLANLPVLIDIVDIDLASKAKPNGGDVVFVDANCNKLKHEIELYNSTTGRLVAWVNVPVLSSATDARLHMYYGNSVAPDQQNATGVWDSGFVMVQHLEELSGTRYDSTLNGNNGTPYFAVSKSYAGKIDGADTFEGTGGCVRIPGGFLPTSAITVELWLKPLSYSNTTWTKFLNTGNYSTSGISGGQSSLTADLWGLSMSWNYSTSFGTGGRPSGFDWVHFAVTWNGTYAHAYVNGLKVREAQITGRPDWTGMPLFLGSNFRGGERFHGVIDEVRISNANRSANWMLTSYNNQKTPDKFYTITSEEKLPEEPIIATFSPYDGAISVPVSISRLTFNLTDYQDDAMNYTVVTVPDIGSGSGINVFNGRYEISVGNTTPSTAYRWTISVTDGTNWTNQTFAFTTEPVVYSWWNISWKHRKAITVDHTKVSANLSNFPVLIDVVDNDLLNGAQPDGDDIVFVDSYGSKLNHELELYNGTTGHLVAWVSIPLLSSVADTRFYMYYENPTAENQQNPTAVWDSNFVMVQHLEESSGTRFDSTLNGSNGTPYFAISKSYAGKIDGADTFEGAGGFVRVPEGFLPTSAITVELWLKPSSYSSTTWTKFLNTGNYTISGICGGQSSLTADLWGLSMSWNYSTSFGTGGRPSGFDWVHFAVTWNGTYAHAYVNGLKVREAQITGVPDWIGMPLFLGSNFRGGERFNGIIDEVRVSNTARSAGWILTSCNNQKAPDTFYAVGSQETIPEGPVISVPSPSNSATRVPLPLKRLSFNLIHYQGKAMNYTLVTYPDIGSGAGSNVFDGRYDVSVKNVAPSTTYMWTVSATDGTNWTNQTYMFTTELGNPPSQDVPLLVSSDGTNKTDEDLICHNQTTYDADGDKVTNIYNWYRNGTSITRLLLPFDTNSSITAKDYSGYNNNGAIVRGVTWTSNGRVGGAYKFDRGYIQIPGTGTLDGDGQWSEITIEHWIYLPADQWGRRSIAKIPSYEIAISGTKISAGVWIDNGRWDVIRYHKVAYDVPLKKSRWYHVAFTYKSDEGLTLYLDGVAVATNPSVNGSIQTSGSEPLFIGWFDYFKGMIDEVRIYPKSLSPQQIHQRYLETKDGLSNNSTIVAQETRIGDAWECKVTPNDSFQDGSTKTSNPLSIGLIEKPTADDLKTTPKTPKTNDDLIGNYTYYDADEDPENGTEIRWYKNSTLQAELNDKLLVPNNLTTRGDVWYFTVRPSDGKEYGRIQTSAPVLIKNSPPTIDSFTPENTTLQINEGESVEFTHTSSDLDNDTLTYSWVLDEIKQSDVQNWTYTADYASAGTHKITLTVSDSELTVSQKWKVLVNDANQPPIIESYFPLTDPTISEGESQEFNITYSDPDGDSVTVQWYLNATSTVSSDFYIFEANYTSAGVYNVTVIISDGFAQASHQWTLTILNVNRPPEALNLTISPPNPKTTDDLIGNYTYYDADGDPENGTEIYWYRNGTLQPHLNGTLIVLANETMKGDEWYFTIRPKDGLDFGILQTSPIMTIQNSPPTVMDLAISPASPLTTDNLTALYTYYDADGDPQSGTEIRWYKDGVLQIEYNDTLGIPSNATTKGETWYFTVKPKDGTDFGELQTSSSVTIQNSSPSISSVVITPNPAYANDTLTANPTNPFDADGDNITYTYQWQKYQNGTWQDIPGATNETLGPENFAKGDQIKVVCTPYDGQDYGFPQEATITISNSPPTITSDYPQADPDPIFVGSPQEFNISCYDLDGDNLTIEWYVNGTLQEAWTGNTSVTFQTDTPGTYVIEVLVSDGESQDSHQWTLVIMALGS